MDKLLIARHRLSDDVINGRSLNNSDELSVSTFESPQIALKFLIFNFLEAFRAIRLEQDLAKKAAIKVTMMATVIPKYLQKFEDILSRSKSGWLVGDGVTWADVYVCVYISLNTDFHQLPLLDGYPALGKMYATLHAIPEIKDWVEKRPKTNT